MRFKYLFSIILLGLSISGCSTKLTFKPHDSVNITFVQDRLNKAAIYNGHLLRMTLSPISFKDYIGVAIKVQNLSNKVVYIDEDKFKFYLSNDLKKWVTKKAYLSNTLYDKEKSSHETTMFWTAVLSGLNAGMSGYGTANTYGRTSNGTSYRSTTYYYDPVARQQAIQNSIRIIDQTNMRGQVWLDFLQNNLFSSKQLRPYDVYEGYVFIDRIQADYLHIVYQPDQEEKFIASYAIDKEFN